MATPSIDAAHAPGGFGRRMGLFARAIALEHTLFALPFAYAGSFIAADGWPGWRTFVWVTMAMVGARSGAMGLNRLVDREIDAKNPRTKGRLTARGVLGARDTLLFSLLSLALLEVAAWQLNPLCLALSPLALVGLWLYPYAKRFTWTCHYWLVLPEFAAAYGGWIAVSGQASWSAAVLGLALGLWIAGFDIVYAFMDLDFDRAHGVYSLPARFGVRPALWVSRFTHIAAAGLFGLFGFMAALGAFYTAAWCGMLIVLIYQHALLTPANVRAAARSFTANLIVGPLLLAGMLLDLFVPK